MATRDTGTATTDKTMNQKVGIAFGAIYLVVGLLGFTVSGGESFIGQDGGLLLGIFEVNGLHNIVHLLIGAALLGGGLSSHTAAKSANMAVGVIYLALGIVGWFIQDTAVDIVALNAADHVLHLLSGALLIAVAQGVGEKTARTA